MRLFTSLLIACTFAMAAGTASAQITVARSGAWSSPATWSTGAVPTATDDVVISADSSVTVDIADAVARNITVASGALFRTDRVPPGSPAIGLTVFGNLVIASGGQLLPLSNQDPDTGVGYGAVSHRLTVHGDIDNSSGGTFDMRRGATSTNPQSASFIDLVFAGSQNSMLTLGDYDSNTNQLFRVEIAKTNGARVILGNDVSQDNNSQAFLTFTSGYIQTNQYKWAPISNNSSVVGTGSPASYVIGEISRTLPTGTAGSQYSRFYPIGDENGYRPLTLYATQRPSGSQSLGVRAVTGDADTGSSVLQGGMTDVSATRYYAITTYVGATNDPIVVERVEPTYGPEDGIPDGSSQFVVATSTNMRATWVNSGGFNSDGTTPHITSLASPPTAIGTGPLTGWTFTITFNGTDFVGTRNYAAIGTTGMFTGASDSPDAQAFALSSAPNPTRNATTIAFSLDSASDVTVAVYDMLGRRVASVVDGSYAAGDHTVNWDASVLSAGAYVLRLQAGSQVDSRMLSVAR